MEGLEEPFEGLAFEKLHTKTLSVGEETAMVLSDARSSSSAEWVVEPKKNVGFFQDLPRLRSGWSSLKKGLKYIFSKGPYKNSMTTFNTSCRQGALCINNSPPAPAKTAEKRENAASPGEKNRPRRRRCFAFVNRSTSTRLRQFYRGQRGPRQPKTAVLVESRSYCRTIVSRTWNRGR